jgi:hypothetical protein
MVGQKCSLIGVASKVLGNSVVEEKETSQRNNIFYSRCLINQKSCNMMIEGGSFTNAIITTLVEDLGMETIKHSNSYKLQWVNDCGEVKVNKQVKVTFSMGKYEDEVVCDVFPMHICQLL